MKWTGLTGGIATGKSTAKKLIEGLGFPVVDADLISHQVTALNQSGYNQVVSHFGQTILNADLSLDRKKLGALIFNDSKKRIELENILHPLIQTEVQKQREQHQASGARLCFYDVPLLFEKNLQNNYDATVLIWCDPAMQLLRLMERNGLSAEEAMQRIRSQMKLIDKVKMATYCVDNSGDMEDLSKQVGHLVDRLKAD